MIQCTTFPPRRVRNRSDFCCPLTHGLNPCLLSLRSILLADTCCEVHKHDSDHKDPLNDANIFTWAVARRASRDDVNYTHVPSPGVLSSPNPSQSIRARLLLQRDLDDDEFCQWFVGDKRLLMWFNLSGENQSENKISRCPFFPVSSS